MDFNKEKCCVLHIGKNNTHKKYHLQNNNDNTTYTLLETTAERDLGIIMDPNLNFDSHINSMTTKANIIL